MSWLLMFLAALSAQMAVLDLVSSPSNHGAKRQVTYTIGGRSFHSARKPPPSFDIELRSISSLQGHASVRVVEVVITNTAASPWLLPVGRDADVALAPRNHGRREMQLFLREQGERNSSIYGSSTFGSLDVRGSEMALAPGGCITVRFPARIEIGLMEHWKSEHKAEVVVRAGLEILPYRDNATQYIVDTTDAPEVLSTNTGVIRLTP